ncbi:hypothetical protein D5400_16935 [Georhizobium profundi]|uniref:DUF6950 domain-containing protein n=1 Tax=Georhizobium profundi TaxID=2341112 RepID=A0A3Q8XQ87_9HYPH|nr:hypothetical protein D5400_16935 [Georhizobium profundi]
MSPPARAGRSAGGSRVASRFEIVSKTVRPLLAEPYAYGTADCFITALAVADALGGTEIAKIYRGRYRTKTGAGRLLRRLGHSSLVTLVDTHFQRCAPAEARVGDIAIVLAEDGEHLAVCAGQAFIVKTERGRRDFPVSTCIAAYRAG